MNGRAREDASPTDARFQISDRDRHAAAHGRPTAGMPAPTMTTFLRGPGTSGSPLRTTPSSRVRRMHRDSPSNDLTPTSLPTPTPLVQLQSLPSLHGCPQRHRKEHAELLREVHRHARMHTTCSSQPRRGHQRKHRLVAAFDADTAWCIEMKGDEIRRSTSSPGNARPSRTARRSPGKTAAAVGMIVRMPEEKSIARDGGVAFRRASQDADSRAVLIVDRRVAPIHRVASNELERATHVPPWSQFPGRPDGDLPRASARSPRGNREVVTSRP